MLKYGAIHGLIVTLIMLGLSALLPLAGIGGSALELINLAIVFIPLAVIGYVYKSKAGKSLLILNMEEKNKLFLYPLGVAIFTAALSSYAGYTNAEIKSENFGVGIVLPIYCLALVSHTFKLAVAIWFGSWFKKTNP